MKSAYVHISDPNGFELALDELVGRIREHIAYEDDVVFPALAELDSFEREQLRDDVTSAVVHASFSPTPPKGALGRAVMGVAEKLDHLVDHDESDPWHPGIDKLEATLENDPNTVN